MSDIGVVVLEPAMLKHASDRIPNRASDRILKRMKDRRKQN